MDRNESSGDCASTSSSQEKRRVDEIMRCL